MSFSWYFEVYVTHKSYIAEVDIKIIPCVFVMCYRYWINLEQCAVYQQQCCEHHEYYW